MGRKLGLGQHEEDIQGRGAQFPGPGTIAPAEGIKEELLDAVLAEERQVEVTRQDLESQVQLAAARSGRPPQEIAKRLTDSGRINDVVQEIREAKALEAMLDLALGRPRSDQADDSSSIQARQASARERPNTFSKWLA